MVDRAVGLVAAHAREIDGKQPPDLLGDRREHLLRRHPARHQRRDAAQRRLLLGQHTQFLTAHWHTVTRPGCGRLWRPAGRFQQPSSDLQGYRRNV